VLSLCILKLAKTADNKKEFKIILSQPNIKNKDSLSDNQRVSKAIEQLNKFSDKKDSVNLILLPELFLDGVYWKETFKESASYLDLKKYLLETFPKSKLLVGATVRKIKKSTENYTNRKFEFDKFNVIAAIDSSPNIRFKTKKEFIPKTENWPKYLNDLIPSPTSANYSLSTDSNFFDICYKRVFTALCYESIFGSYCSESVKTKSDFIVLLASESFLNSNKTALKQYLNICKVRAIENGKYFIKCSNEGYSAIISPYGKIVVLLPYDRQEYIYYSL
jgi:apolipoprotein N-acyltransferase